MITSESQYERRKRSVVFGQAELSDVAAGKLIHSILGTDRGERFDCVDFLGGVFGSNLAARVTGVPEWFCKSVIGLARNCTGPA